MSGTKSPRKAALVVLVAVLFVEFVWSLHDVYAAIAANSDPQFWFPYLSAVILAAFSGFALTFHRPRSSNRGLKMQAQPKRSWGISTLPALGLGIYPLWFIEGTLQMMFYGWNFWILGLKVLVAFVFGVVTGQLLRTLQLRA